VEGLRHAGAAGNPTMDVQCERCKTEYEFDDALVSGRGTTVRCTTCGHQFKVRRTEGADASDEDRWLVKTANGHQFTFVTLRELQRAILAHQVSRSDLLRRAGAAPRPLGSISELEPFFEGRTTSTRPPPPGPADEAPPVPSFPKRSSITWEDDAPAPAMPRSNTASYGQAPQGRAKVDTLRVLPGAGAAPVAAPIVPQPIVSATPYPAQRVPFHEHTTAVESVEVREAAPPPAPPPAPWPEVSSPLPAPTRPVRRRTTSSDFDSAETRSSIPSSLDEPYSARRGRRVGGWIVALVLLLAVGVLGWAIARPYVLARGASAAAQLDPRAEAFLAEGEKAISAGDLDQAAEAFDKASALAENEPRVRLDQARVATAQADVPWLKLRLLPVGAVDQVRATKADMTERVGRAGRLADEALASAPDAPAAARVKIDALRLAGQPDAARAFVAKVIGQASQPETAYVLAALDLAEPEPLWTTVLERLRLAASGEGAAGRARAALVYSLAKSGDTADARTELAKLDALAHPSPLSPDLHALVDKLPAKGVLDAGAPAAPARGPAIPAGTAGGVPAPAAPGGGGDSIPGDSRSAMQVAAQAYKKGDLGRARQIYEAIATRNPTDSEAVAALGDVARAQGDSSGAITDYKRAITVNPSYLPALLGLADTQWSSGDKASATRGYGDIVDRFPEGTYPPYVKQRIDAASAATAGPAAAPASPPETAKPASPAASDESSP
jgi:predicted Zn finger-like uncharacterized protein